MGFPVARRMIEHAPSRLIITSLHRKEAEEAVNELQAQPITQATSIEPAWLSRSATVPVLWRVRRMARSSATRRVRPGRMAAWIFCYEDKGERIKR